MTHKPEHMASTPLTTDSLIAALTADLPTRPVSIGRAILVALVVGVPISGLVIALGILPVRSDFFRMLFDARVSFKFAFSLAVLAAGVWLALRVLRPGTRTGPANWALAAVALIVAVGVVTEMSSVPMDNWSANMSGVKPWSCVMLIQLLSAVPLAAMLYMFRAGAPDKPALAGAAAGLIAAGIGATAFAFHCTNDSSLFVAAWYGIAMASVVAAGALFGSRVLRW